MSGRNISIGGILLAALLVGALSGPVQAQPSAADEPTEAPAPPTMPPPTTPPLPPLPDDPADSSTPPPPGETGSELPSDPLGEPEVGEVEEPAVKYKVGYICSPAAGNVENQSNLCVVDSDGKNPRVMVVGGILAAPVWSLDGQFIYFSYDKGPANLEALPGMPPVSIPHNFDVHYLRWSDGAHLQLTDSPAPEFLIQDLPAGNELLLTRRRFVNETSQLGVEKKKLEIKLKLIDFPCVFSMTEQNCESLGATAGELANSDCPPLALPLPLGLSPFGRWATQSAMLCDEGVRKEGFFLVDTESDKRIPVLHKDLSACRVIDFHGGIAVNDDGSPMVIPFNTKSLKIDSCVFYLSPERQRMAYINVNGQVGVIDLNSRQLQYMTVEAPVQGIDALAWSPGGNDLLAFKREGGGPMYRISALIVDDVSFLGYGSQPAWSPIPLATYTSEATVAAAETIELDNVPAEKTQIIAQPAAGCTLIR